MVFRILWGKDPFSSCNQETPIVVSRVWEGSQEETELLERMHGAQVWVFVLQVLLSGHLGRL